MTKMTIEECWNEYRDSVIPKTKNGKLVSRVPASFSKHAYYAGVAAMFEIMTCNDAVVSVDNELKAFLEKRSK